MPDRGELGCLPGATRTEPQAVRHRAGCSRQQGHAGYLLSDKTNGAVLQSLSNELQSPFPQNAGESLLSGFRQADYPESFLAVALPDAHPETREMPSATESTPPGCPRLGFYPFAPRHALAQCAADQGMNLGVLGKPLGRQSAETTRQSAEGRDHRAIAAVNSHSSGLRSSLGPPPPAARILPRLRPYARVRCVRIGGIPPSAVVDRSCRPEHAVIARTVHRRTQAPGTPADVRYRRQSVLRNNQSHVQLGSQHAVPRQPLEVCGTSLSEQARCGSLLRTGNRPAFLHYRQRPGRSSILRFGGAILAIRQQARPDLVRLPLLPGLARPHLVGYDDHGVADQLPLGAVFQAGSPDCRFRFGHMRLLLASQET